MIAFMAESWKHEGVPEVGEWGSHMFVLLLWFVIANGLVFLLLAFWVGCGAWSLIRYSFSLPSRPCWIVYNAVADVGSIIATRFRSGPKTGRSPNENRKRPPFPFAQCRPLGGRGSSNGQHRRCRQACQAAPMIPAQLVKGRVSRSERAGVESGSPSSRGYEVTNAFMVKSPECRAERECFPPG